MDICTHLCLLVRACVCMCKFWPTKCQSLKHVWLVLCPTESLQGHTEPFPLNSKPRKILAVASVQAFRLDCCQQFHSNPPVAWTLVGVQMWVNESEMGVWPSMTGKDYVWRRKERLTQVRDWILHAGIKCPDSPTDNSFRIKRKREWEKVHLPT